MIWRQKSRCLQGPKRKIHIPEKLWSSYCLINRTTINGQVYYLHIFLFKKSNILTGICRFEIQTSETSSTCHKLPPSHDDLKILHKPNVQWKGKRLFYSNLFHKQILIVTETMYHSYWYSTKFENMWEKNA